MSSIFFFKKKNIHLNKIFPKNNFTKSFIIENIKPLSLAKKKDLTFFDKQTYIEDAKKTNAGVCITTINLSHFLPKNTQKIIVKNVLYVLAVTLKKNLSICRY